MERPRFNVSFTFRDGGMAEEFISPGHKSYPLGSVLFDLLGRDFRDAEQVREFADSWHIAYFKALGSKDEFVPVDRVVESGAYADLIDEQRELYKALTLWLIGEDNEQMHQSFMRHWTDRAIPLQLTLGTVYAKSERSLDKALNNLNTADNDFAKEQSVNNLLSSMKVELVYGVDSIIDLCWLEVFMCVEHNRPARHCTTCGRPFIVVGKRLKKRCPDCEEHPVTNWRHMKSGKLEPWSPPWA